MRLVRNRVGWLKFVAVVVLGAGLGYGYYHFFGCRGACPLTNNAMLMVGIGALFGANFGFDFILSKKKEKEEEL